MNIIIFIPSLTAGGAEKQAVIDANLLSENHNTYLVFFRSGPFESQINKAVHKIQIQGNGYFKRARFLSKIINEYKINIIHASIFSAMIISALASLRSKVEIVWSFHSHEFDAPFKSYWAYRLFGNTKAVTKILFVNRNLLTYWQKRCRFRKSKLSIMYNCATIVDCFKKEVTTKIILGYVGRIVELKRIDYLIQLAIDLLSDNINNFKIIIVGDGLERENLEKLVNNNNLNHFIDFVGYCATPAEYYSQIDIYLQPSREECLSISMIDAGFASLPVVAFNVGGNPEIVINNKTGYIVEIYDDFREKIKKLLLDSNLRFTMGQESKQHCKKKFSPEAHLNDLWRVYESIKTN